METLLTKFSNDLRISGYNARAKVFQSGIMGFQRQSLRLLLMVGLR